LGGAPGGGQDSVRDLYVSLNARKNYMNSEELSTRLMLTVAKNIRERSEKFKDIYNIEPTELKEIADRLVYMTKSPHQG
jgi:hypothetical protein